MRTFSFYQLDVFTDQRFAGNSLAVFPDGAGISDAEMQQIAREMNLSETVFVLPSNEPEALRRLRIFTPTKELPLAGHPVVGTWNLLARLGFIEDAPANGSVEIKHELGVGVLPVEIEFQNDEPRIVTMTQDKFVVKETITDENVRNTIISSLNLTPEDLRNDAPIQVCSTGADILMVPVRSLDALRRLRPNTAKMADLPTTLNGEFYCFAQETFEKDSKFHARMFAPEFGIVEDPATGGAAGPMGGYLLYHGLLDFAPDNDGAFRFIIEQGDFMKRPSRIHVEVIGGKGNIERVRVGGTSVVVASGEIFF
jgi:trans-2,3-dihydro-3-hydroxyanthranilate isomerase